MKSVSIALFFLLCAAAYGKPSFHADEARAAGLTVLTPDDPRFAVALQAIALNPKSNLQGFDAVRPYSLIVINSTRQPIMMLSVRWEDPDGRFRGHFTLWSRPNLYTGDWLPGESMLILPGFPATGHVGPGYAGLSGRVPPMFAAGDPLVGTIDAVLFADGRLVGPDKGGARLGLRAEREAIEDTAKDLERLTAAGTDGTEYLQALAKSRPLPTLSIAEQPSDTAYSYARMRQKLAAVLLTKAGSTDIRIQAKVARALVGHLAEIH